MFTKTTFALALVLATASGALAATKQQSSAPRNDVYDVRGTYVGSDPDANVRFELHRDADRGK
jgi:hypothetical protein